MFVDPDSRLEAFDEDSGISFIGFDVCWHLPFGLKSNRPIDFLVCVENVLRSDEWPTDWLAQRLPLWKKIALNECLQFLHHSLQEHRLELSPGEKTIAVVKGLLENFSAAQVCNFIWRATRDAAAFMVRKSTSKQHAANTVVGAMQRFGERALAEGWDTKPFGRNFDCPQSMVSQVLFNLALKIGELGFSGTPVIEEDAVPESADGQ